MIRFLMYTAIACASYFAGLLGYMGSLFLLYGETLGNEGSRLVGWTLAPYLVLLLPACTLLHLWQRRSYAARIALLLFASLCSAAAVPAMMGFWFAWLIAPLSPELLLFLLQFLISAAMFSLGTAVSAAKRGLLVYLGLSAAVVSVAIFGLTRFA